MKLSFGIAFIAAALVTTVASTAPAQFDPIAALKAKGALRLLSQGSSLSRATVAQVVSKKLVSNGQSDHVEVELKNGDMGPIRLLLVGPRGFLDRTDAPYGALFFASGLFSGKSAVELLGTHPGLVLIGYDYPLTVDDLKKNPAAALQGIERFLKKTPLQIAAALQWISQQPWTRFDAINTMGVSLGGLVLPVGEHLAMSVGTSIHGTVLAFTGAHLPPVLEHSLKAHMNADVLRGAMALANNIMTLHDPKLHLPFLEGQFLTIRADSDQVFPRESSQILENLLPHPKTIEVVHGPHIDLNQREVISQTQAVVRHWLSTWY